MGRGVDFVEGLAAHGMRRLAQVQQAATPVPVVQLTAGDCQKLAGVTIGGWITVALLVGILVGAVGVLTIQSCRRWRRQRYAAHAGTELAGAPAPLTPAPAAKAVRDSVSQLPPLLPTRDPVLRSSRKLSANAAPVGFSPLTASVTLPGAHGTPAKGMPAAVRAAAGAAAGGGRAQQDAPATAGDTRAGGDQRRAPPNGAVPTGDRHADAIRVFVATEYVDQSGSPLSSPGTAAASWVQAPAAAQPAPAGAAPPPPQPQPSDASSDAAVRPGAARPAASGPAPPSPLPSVSAGGPHPDVDDSYEVEDLDADWKALLGDVDGRLQATGAPPMDSRERAVAIKKLLVATATRGVDSAMDSTLQEVLRFRAFHSSGKR